MKKSFVVTLIALAVVFGAVFGWKWFLHRKMSAVMAQRAAHFSVAVSVSSARMVSRAIELHSVGSVSAVNGVDLTSQLAGNVTSLTFRSGEYVRRGTRLLEINDAVVVRAPFSGHLGIRQVSLGQYVGPGTPLVPLEAWDPLHVDFSLPQSALPRIKIGAGIIFRVNAYPNRQFAGKVSAIDSTVAVASRTIEVRATLRNPGFMLRPGMFGTVTLTVGHSLPVLVVPATAMAYNTFGDYVYVIRQVKHGAHSLDLAFQAPVDAGTTRHGLTEVIRGLKAGEPVVVAGQIKLRNGMPVTIHAAAVGAAR
ncbi:MAG: efflux RND transporter periplasmic adaptor subunit [Acidiferrobacteraceae bacterium]